MSINAYETPWKAKISGNWKQQQHNVPGSAHTELQDAHTSAQQVSPSCVILVN
jgi:hypothetical protein